MSGGDGLRVGLMRDAVLAIDRLLRDGWPDGREVSWFELVWLRSLLVSIHDALRLPG